MSSRGIPPELNDTGYGKTGVKLLQLKRDGKVHYVTEVEVDIEVTMDDHRGFVYADNTHVIATDSMKNTVYILAKQYGIQTIEQFAMMLCKHFLQKYPHVVTTRVYVEQLPWKRIDLAGEKHIHAFLVNRESIRTCEVVQDRGGMPLIGAGLKDMKIMKTTASAFTDFVDDEYRTLPDAHDRMWCTAVRAKWWYKADARVDFDVSWEEVKSCIVEVFAGPPRTGQFSPSVQNTLYLAEKKCLEKISHLEKIEMVFPNMHYWKVDYTCFPRLDFSDSPRDIYIPNEKPSGKIRATLCRRPVAKL